MNGPLDVSLGRTPTFVCKISLSGSGTSTMKMRYDSHPQML
jgi:hypothetical protein